MLNRRYFLLATLAGTFPAFAESKVYKFFIGKTEVTVFSDGLFSIPLSIALPSKSPAEIESVFKAAKLEPIRAGDLNIVLIKTGDDLTLIDCGSNTNFAPSVGLLAKRLEEAGISLESITKVVLTHGHPDHLWGALDEFNTPMFPKAKYIISTIERDYWLNPQTIVNTPDQFKGFAAGSARIIKELAPVLVTAKADEKLAEGLYFRATPGHTPGHMAVRLESGKDQLLITGDAINNNVISFAKPDWHWGSDVDKEQGAKTRAALLSELAVDKISLLGYHLPFPGVGRVEKLDNAYIFRQ